MLLFFFLNLSCGKSIFNKGCLATKSWYIKYQDFIKFETNSLSSLLIFFSIVFNILSYKGKRNWNQVSNISKKRTRKIPLRLPLQNRFQCMTTIHISMQFQSQWNLWLSGSRSIYKSSKSHCFVACYFKYIYAWHR